MDKWQLIQTKENGAGPQTELLENLEKQLPWRLAPPRVPERAVWPGGGVAVTGPDTSTSRFVGIQQGLS